MKIYRLFLLIIFIAACSQHTDHDWQPLFVEGGNNWSTIGEAVWETENDQLTGKEGTGMGFAITKDTYSNFHLKLEFFPDSAVNSGIFFRCAKDSISPVNCYEANIWDEHVNQDFRTGAIVRQSNPPLVKVNTLNRWNTYEIKADGDHIQVWVNDQKTVDFKSDLASEGIIALQLFKEGNIKFRNVMIKEL